MKKFFSIFLSVIFTLSLVDFAFAAPRARRVRPSGEDTSTAVTSTTPTAQPAAAEQPKAEETSGGETKIKSKLGKAAIEAEAKAKAGAEAKKKSQVKAKAEAETRAKKEAEDKAKKEAEDRAKLEMELKAKAETEARAKLEAEMKLKQDAEAKAKADAEAKARAEAEAKTAAEAQSRAESEALLSAKAAEERSKRGPRSRTRVKEETPVESTSGKPMTKETAEASKALAKAEEEARAKAEALKKAEAKAQAMSQVEDKQRAKEEDKARLRAEEEARTAEAATAAALIKAQEASRAGTATKPGKGSFVPFIIYSDNGMKGNHYYPTGWMGDFGDLKFNPANNSKVHSGTTAIKITYVPKMSQNAGWVGIYWQYPPNNWGDKKGGYNLAGAKKLSFWACGEKGGEVISEFKVGGISGEFPDSDNSSIGPIELSKKWQNYTIDLQGRDLTNVIGGFCFSASKDDNPEGFNIYLDDLIFE
ncbi:MAG: hypothetical protein NT145_08025 [Elusimicrobia bacterium]|nr:hypothetical protein [Elusimicrobiota bacterium]